MSRLLAIDPSIRHTGWALFNGSNLADCGLIKAPTKLGQEPMPARIAWVVAAIRTAAPKADILLMEWPQIYAGGGKGDPNGLMAITAIIGGLIALYDSDRCRLVLPREWKGQVPKDVHNARVVASLDGRGRAILDACDAAPSLRHNVIDAIGLGQYGICNPRPR